MLKKVKDLTKEERRLICEKHNCYDGKCPLHCVDMLVETFEYTQSVLNSEVEVEG